MIDIGKKQEGGVRREVPMCCLFKTASLKNILNSTNLLLRIICDAHLSLLIEQQNDFFDRDKQVLTLSQGNFYLGSRKNRRKKSGYARMRASATTPEMPRSKQQLH